MNFTIDLTLTEAEKWGSLHPNGSSSGAMNRIISGQADLAIGKFALTRKRIEYMKPSMSYNASPFVIVVPVGEALSALEKLMKPFSYIIWSLVISTLLIAIIVIASIRWKLNKNSQNFVLGAGNTSPYLNTLSVLLGGSLPHLPIGTFSRSLLSIFMLYCLVIRNSYTGALFTFIRSDVIHKPSVRTINEMVEKGFTFYMIPTAQESTEAIKQLHARRSIISPLDVPQLYEKMNDPSFKGGLISTLDRVVYFNMINHNNYTLNVCKEQLLSMQYAMYFQKHSSLTQSFDVELMKLQTNGFLSHLNQNNIQNKYLKPDVSIRRPKALQLQQVMGSFWILLFGLLCAIFVGLVECIIN